MSTSNENNEENLDTVFSPKEETEMAFQIFSERLKGRRKSVLLFEQLQCLEKRLKEKEIECEHLSQEQNQTDNEIQELTAAIFEEANKMIQEATLKRMSAEKKVKESEEQIEILKEEVVALKRIIHSNRERNNIPNQLSTALSLLSPSSPSILSTFIKGHRRASSHCTPSKSDHCDISQHTTSNSNRNLPIITDFDGGRRELFMSWKCKPTLDQSNAFINDLIKWDITPCLEFPNKKLSNEIYKAIFKNQLFVEPLNKLFFENFCNLCQQNTTCHYKVSLDEDQANTTAISTFARNRVISVCSLVSYLRYITQGIVKIQEEQIYSEILNLLRKMSLARLGFVE